MHATRTSAGPTLPVRAVTSASISPINRRPCRHRHLQRLQARLLSQSQARLRQHHQPPPSQRNPACTQHRCGVQNGPRVRKCHYCIAPRPVRLRHRPAFISTLRHRPRLRVATAIKGATTSVPKQLQGYVRLWKMPILRQEPAPASVPTRHWPFFALFLVVQREARGQPLHKMRLLRMPILRCGLSTRRHAKGLRRRRRRSRQCL